MADYEHRTKILAVAARRALLVPVSLIVGQFSEWFAYVYRFVGFRPAEHVHRVCRVWYVDGTVG